MKILIVVLLVIIAFCVTVLYDARKITKKYFGNQDQNQIAWALKAITCIIIVACGAAIVYFIYKGI